MLKKKKKKPALLQGALTKPINDNKKKARLHERALNVYTELDKFDSSTSQ